MRVHARYFCLFLYAACPTHFQSAGQTATPTAAAYSAASLTYHSDGRSNTGNTEGTGTDSGKNRHRSAAISTGAKSGEGE